VGSFFWRERKRWRNLEPSFLQPSILCLKMISKVCDQREISAPEQFCHVALLTMLFAGFRAGGYLNEMMAPNLVFAFSLLPTEPLLPFAQCRCAVLASSFGALPFRLFGPTQQRLGPFPSSSSSGYLTLSLRDSKIN
jgi:hypothetical protein